MGRPTFEPNDKQRTTVSVMAAAGFKAAVICERIINPQTGLAIDEKTLRLYFKTELAEGRDHANALVTQALFKTATSGGMGSVAAAIFWLKCRAGWKETQVVEHTLRKPRTLNEFYEQPNRVIDVTPSETTPDA